MYIYNSRLVKAPTAIVTLVFIPAPGHRRDKIFNYGNIEEGDEKYSILYTIKNYLSG